MQTKDNQSKFEKVYDEHKSHMKYVALNILKDNYLAEDAVHNSFLKIINSPEKIDENEYNRTAAFLNIIVKREALNILKKERKGGIKEDIESEAVNISSPVDVENLVIGKETVNRILSIVNDMKEIYRDVFVLYYTYNYTVKEISVLTEESEAVVYKRLQRAKHHIAERIGKEKQI